jgi:hypothetical protein
MAEDKKQIKVSQNVPVAKRVAMETCKGSEDKALSLLTYLLTYSLTHSLHGARYYLKS